MFVSMSFGGASGRFYQIHGGEFRRTPLGPHPGVVGGWWWARRAKLRMAQTAIASFFPQLNAPQRPSTGSGGPTDRFGRTRAQLQQNLRGPLPLDIFAPGQPQLLFRLGWEGLGPRRPRPYRATSMALAPTLCPGRCSACYWGRDSRPGHTPAFWSLEKLAERPAATARLR